MSIIRLIWNGDVKHWDVDTTYGVVDKLMDTDFCPHCANVEDFYYDGYFPVGLLINWCEANNVKLRIYYE